VVEGHAGFEQAGKDIVCAAVSVLTQAVVLGLKRIVEIEPDTLEINEGRLVCRIGEMRRSEEHNYKHDQVQLLLSTMVLGLEETASSYPDHIIMEYLYNN